ncbi:uncharacterized protein BDZ99DRAFT_457543 [Mytilinidion resinicola]|uniref:F-box domain-containing protein n=1 Tax=Mytilinidion resinicola TaxID=574789 RepID=A0A6A6ZBA5_9PEZI|nr:uncharacterized protein BDZ99DRAFT_457543 [Mytilinidion resinicola]KAF2817979.1 hypothetical protein BDZ99DRAFT_457543 [Mytilinidion resinicola]
MTSSLELLPQELLEEVCLYGTLEDLRALRLASRELRRKSIYIFGSRYLHSVSAMISPSSLNAIQEIAGREELQQHVQDVTIGPERLSSNLPVEPLRTSYKARLAAQNEFESRGDDHRLLAAIFASLPNLRWIRVGPWGQMCYDPYFRPKLSIGAKEIKKTYFRPSKADHSTLKVLQQFHNYDNDHAYREFGVVFKALRASGISRPLLDLHLCARDPHVEKYEVPQREPFDLDSRDWKAVHPLLRAVHISLLRWEHRFSLPWLQQFLPVLPEHLEQIIIEHYFNAVHDGQGRVNSLHLLSQGNLPNLTRLVVDFYYAPEEKDLNALLKMLSPSLETLVLSQFHWGYRSDASWHGIFRTIMGMKSLRAVHLYELEAFGSQPGIPSDKIVHKCFPEYDREHRTKNDSIPRFGPEGEEWKFCDEGRAVDLYGQAEIQEELGYAIAHGKWHLTCDEWGHSTHFMVWFRTKPGKAMQAEGHSIYNGERPIWKTA